MKGQELMTAMLLLERLSLVLFTSNYKNMTLVAQSL
jgi:hypothetical protein